MTENTAIVIIDEKAVFLDNIQELFFNSLNLLSILPQGRAAKFGTKVYTFVKSAAMFIEKKALEVAVNTVGNKIIEDVVKTQLTCLFFFIENIKTIFN